VATSWWSTNYDEVVLSDEIVKSRITYFVKRIQEIYEKYYPSPLPNVSVKAPINEDWVDVTFRRPVKVSRIFFPTYAPTATVYVWRSNSIKRIEIDVKYGKVYAIDMIDNNGRKILSDYGGEIALTYMLMPEFMEALRTASIDSVHGTGAKWLEEFLDIAKEVRELSGYEEVKSLDPRELLNKDEKMNHIMIDIQKPVKNLDSVEIRSWIDGFQGKPGLGIFFTKLYFSRGGLGTVESDLNNGDVVNLNVTGVFGVGEKRVKKYLLLVLTDSLLDDIEDAIKSFVDAYKYFRLTLSMMNI